MHKFLPVRGNAVDGVMTASIPRFAGEAADLLCKSFAPIYVLACDPVRADQAKARDPQKSKNRGGGQIEDACQMDFYTDDGARQRLRYGSPGLCE